MELVTHRSLGQSSESFATTVRVMALLPVSLSRAVGAEGLGAMIFTGSGAADETRGVLKPYAQAAEAPAGT